MIQAMMMAMPDKQLDLPPKHRFTPGMYIRELFMPAGSLIMSKIHKTEHPYVVSKGKVSVWIEGAGVEVITAPHTGITMPGTRRCLFVHEDTLWTTFHVTNETDLEKIEDQLIEKHEVEPLSDDIVRLLKQEDKL